MSKRISKANNIKYALSGNDRYIAAVDPGETFVVECAINANDGTIRHLGQQLTEADVTFPFVNGATGPIEVRGSKAGGSSPMSQRLTSGLKMRSFARRRSNARLS